LSEDRLADVLDYLADLNDTDNISAETVAAIEEVSHQDPYNSRLSGALAGQGVLRKSRVGGGRTPSNGGGKCINGSEKGRSTSTASGL
jgi:hypothetical protein